MKRQRELGKGVVSWEGKVSGKRKRKERMRTTMRRGKGAVLRREGISSFEGNCENDSRGSPFDRKGCRVI